LTYIDYLYIIYVDDLYIGGLGMAADKGMVAGNTTMLILKLLEEKDLYGYQMIEELSQKSNDTFNLKAGTLYPILHGLENEGMVSSYDDNADSSRTRKYYHLTQKGKGLLVDKQAEWTAYSKAVNQVLRGGVGYATI
jgi:PadR family transcriptional regulator PadR